MSGVSDVSVIVVAYNSSDVIGRCVSALPTEVEVVVVDNASSDDSAETALRARPGCRVVDPGVNLGFGGGCQAGAEAASRPLLLFLNPDAQIEHASIETLVATLSRHPRALVGPRMLGADGHTRPLRRKLDILKDALWLLPASGRWIPTSWKHGPEVRSDHEHPVLYVEGACFMVRREDLADAGGFDRDMFLYFEESSLAHRLGLLGGAAWYEPRASATHLGQTSTAQRERLATFHFYRSRVIYERKTRGDWVGRMRSVPLLLAALVAVLGAALQQSLRGRRGVVADALAAVKGAAAGLSARVGPRY